MTGLISLSRGRVVDAKVLDPAIDAPIEVAIDEHCLTPECPPLASLVRDLARRCLGRSLRAPTYKAILAQVIARKRFDGSLAGLRRNARLGSVGLRNQPSNSAKSASG